MAPLPTTPGQSGADQPRVRTSNPRSSRSGQSSGNTSSEPPHKKRRYVPGGPGGGGRYVDPDGTEVPVGGTGPGGYLYTGPRGRVGRENLANGVQPPLSPSLDRSPKAMRSPIAERSPKIERSPRRERSSRSRTTLQRFSEEPLRFSSAAQVAAVAQSDGYKPREERAWEEFHPDLDIETEMHAFSADDVDGIIASISETSVDAENSEDKAMSTTDVPVENIRYIPREEWRTFAHSPILLSLGVIRTDSARKGSVRPRKDTVAFLNPSVSGSGVTSVSTPKIKNVSVQNINAKEKLTLPQPSYRKSETLARFEDKSLGLVRYVDKSMANVGYQESDIFIRPERKLIKVSDTNLEEDLDLGPGFRNDGDTIVAIGSGGVGRVEYDMDEQDDKWLQDYNAERKAQSHDAITREIFEITITKIEKEWHALEKRIPKPNPKPPQTHRPRSSSAAAVNGEPQVGEEQDSKCAICDDGDCENTNAIVFCDGCDLAVHQECYGVPFIPEGQWLCRKCQLIGRGIPTCIFCPNTDGAFKQTNSSKWAHLLCAMWIPEVSLGNHTFMEPVMEVEKVPKTRWKLTCYICQQRMGACIQCGNKACYQAFHVTCARRARLFLKMKNNHGTLAVLDGTTILKAFCDKHCPADYTKENQVASATLQARNFYKRTMRGRLWADSQASALAMAATHRHAVTEHPPDESQLINAKVNMNIGDKKKGQPPKTIWRLPSGAPVIPQVVFNSVESSLQRFMIRKRKEYAADACKYWTLKREARRGAALLKRLQLQMETFSSMEITRRNFSGMGPPGRGRLERRIEFAHLLVKDLERLKELSEAIVQREEMKLRAAEMEEDLVDTLYFPISRLMPPIVEKAITLDIKNCFTDGLLGLRAKLEERYYTSAIPFTNELCSILAAGIMKEPQVVEKVEDFEKTPGSKKHILDIKERRKLAKRILKAVQPQLEAALRAEADINEKPAENILKELEVMVEACVQARRQSLAGSQGSIFGGLEVHETEHDIEMANSTTDGASINANAEPRNNESQDTEMQESEATAIGNAATLKVPTFATEAEEIEHQITSTALAHGGDSKDDKITLAFKSTDVDDVVKAAMAAGNTPPDSNSFVTRPSDSDGPPPPTPPVSNGDAGTDPLHSQATITLQTRPAMPGPHATAAAGSLPADLHLLSSISESHAHALSHGGIPWYLKDFEPDGTSVLQQERWTGREVVARLSEELSDMDDEELQGLGGAFADLVHPATTTPSLDAAGLNGNAIVVGAPVPNDSIIVPGTPSAANATPKTKKGKAKKRWRGFR